MVVDGCSLVSDCVRAFPVDPSLLWIDPIMPLWPSRGQTPSFQLHTGVACAAVASRGGAGGCYYEHRTVDGSCPDSHGLKVTD